MFVGAFAFDLLICNLVCCALGEVFEQDTFYVMLLLVLDHVV